MRTPQLATCDVRPASQAACGLLSPLCGMEAVRWVCYWVECARAVGCDPRCNRSHSQQAVLCIGHPAMCHLLWVANLYSPEHRHLIRARTPVPARACWSERTLNLEGQHCGLAASRHAPAPCVAVPWQGLRQLVVAGAAAAREARPSRCCQGSLAQQTGGPRSVQGGATGGGPHGPHEDCLPSSSQEGVLPAHIGAPQHDKLN